MLLSPSPRPDGSRTPELTIMGTWVFLCWLTRPEREADRSFSSGTEVMNAWSFNCCPPVPLYGAVLKLSDSLTFTDYRCLSL